VAVAVARRIPIAVPHFAAASPFLGRYSRVTGGGATPFRVVRTLGTCIACGAGFGPGGRRTFVYEVAALI
jgi:hypothetical protein